MNIAVKQAGAMWTIPGSEKSVVENCFDLFEVKN